MIQEDFSFNQAVAEVFDDMLNRSIPCYHRVIGGIIHLLNQRLPDGATVVDLGCSTGTTLLALHQALGSRNFVYRGVDQSEAMLTKAREKSERLHITQGLTFHLDDITTHSLGSAHAILCNYTVQFIRPLLRLGFLERIFAALRPGGLCILSEKTIAASATLNRDFIAIYHQFKKQQGYSELEIAAKREALENVLVPFTAEENIALLHQVGFSEAELFFRWFNFSSIVALKK